jgi:hypothetical protein
MTFNDPNDAMPWCMESSFLHAHLRCSGTALVEPIFHVLRGWKSLGTFREMLALSMSFNIEAQNCQVATI